ncbi:hypothetical protein SCHPADRAFT_603043 [Schizopora paradoxa]|uniref:Uncharacterized protein n=1 Tax=Schizopora paradoxa TaxID=27342 RepID=A0A0H2RGB5_9AGAM|nr:hypothetical protein SCHPADRAFT_603043 [Schizopora paradoxa]
MPIKLSASPPSPPISNQMATCSKSVATPSAMTERTSNVAQTNDDRRFDVKDNAKGSKTPEDGSVSVTLDCPSIGDVMAARLAMCVLGHMLYLKSQIPFPVPQLMKMSATSANSSSNSKGKKKLDTLLSSFDLLSSHLGTTFTALSTALARSQVNSPSIAHFVILFGPTVSAASAATSTRARIMLEITGFDVRIWGMRNDRRLDGEDNDDDDQEEDIPPDSDEEEDDSVDGDEEEESEDEVPPSPEPSDFDSDVEEEEEGPYIPSSSSYIPPESEIVLAERTLSRTLAQANADASAGMAAEIPPTQIHVLIRAPRRFAHPAWKPHQQSGVSRALDTMISNPIASKSKTNKKQTDHRIRVRCQSSENADPSGVSKETDEDEESEFIWWSWDAGKLEGFSDW